MSKFRLFTLVLLLVLLVPAQPQSASLTPVVFAQGCDGMSTALQTAQANCRSIWVNGACYGNPDVTAGLTQGVMFDQSHRTVFLDYVTSIRVEWTGVAVLALQPAASASPVRLTLFGGAETGLTQAPERISLSTFGGGFCSDMPAVMVAYTPNGESSQFTVNGVLIELASTAVITRGNKTIGSGGASGRVVFGSNRDGNWEIYMMDLSTLSPVRLTTNGAVDNSPRLSPDGTRIVYQAGPVVDDFGTEPGTELYVMNVDGSNRRQLTNNGVSDALASWSPDGSRLAFVSTRDGNQEIYTMTADGNNVTRLTYDNSVDSWPVWSPNGSQIAFYRRGGGVAHIYVMNADGSNQHAITSGSDYDQVPSWSPDGSQIAFASTREDPVGYWHIYVVGVNGGTPYRVTQENSWAPAWTPDGQIIYMSNRDGDQELFLINADGSNDRRLTDNRASEENPNMAFGQRATVADVMTVANRQGTVYVTASGQRQRLDPGQAIDINLSTPSPTLIFPVIANSPLPRYGLITDAEAILTSVGFSSID